MEQQVIGLKCLPSTATLVSKDPINVSVCKVVELLLVNVSKWVNLTLGRFLQIMAISRQKQGRNPDYVLLL